MSPRLNWDAYFMQIAKVVATRATCDRLHVGSVIVDERHRVVSTGFNGAPKGLAHCDDVGHDLREIDGRMSCVRVLHSESNALDDAGRRSEGGTIYVTVIPCYRCAQRIVQHGIKRVVYGKYYESQMTARVEAYFKEAGIEMVQA